MNACIRGRAKAKVAGALRMVSALALAGCVHSTCAWALDPAQQAGDPAPQPRAEATARAWTQAESLRYKRNWGVDVEGVKVVESGYMLAFRYRVLDAGKARPLNDKKTRPFIIDEATGVRLSVPAMEKVGELRQMTEPEEGRRYFIIFGNPGKLVKPGSRVTVAIGNFRVEGLAVQ